jgi:hypothetical protein
MMIMMMDFAKRALAGTAAALLISSVALADGKWQSNVVSVPVTYDSGADVGGSVNNAISVAACTDEAPTFVYCSSGVSTGSICNPAGGASQCGGAGAGVCTTTSTSQAGVSAGDAHGSITLDVKKSKCKVKGSALQAKVTFVGATDTDQNDGSIGRCFGDSASTCKKSKDCETETSNNGPCLSGDEFWAQFDFLAAPASTCLESCVLALNHPTLTGGATICFVGTCAHPAAEGYLCDVAGAALTCPVGTCNAAGVPGSTADSIAFDLGSAQAFVMCPVQAGLSFPFEVKKGKGKVKVSLEDSAFAITVPPTTKLDILGCFIHEAARPDRPDLMLPVTSTVGRVADSIPLGVHVGTADTSCAKRPCPERTGVLDGPGLSAVAGGNIHFLNPVSPIIGVSGVTGPAAN